MLIEDRIEELQRISKDRMNDLHPLLQTKLLKFVEVAAYNGLYFAVFQGVRTWTHQRALYAQGRELLTEVNRIRRIVNLGPISEAANRRRVTKAKPGESWHNYALVADLVEDGDPNKAGVQWSWKSNRNYLKLKPIVRSLRMTWGGFWKSFKDYPHMGLDLYGMTLAQAKSIYLSSGNNVHAVWTELALRTPDGVARYDRPENWT